MLNYFEGAEHCRTNSRRLETSARIILTEDDGADSFGLFLYYIAYEEMAKAIFCLFVDRKWIPEEFVNKVFRDHRAKIFLYDEIFRSFKVVNNEGYLGDKKLGEISLDDFIEEHSSIIKMHRRLTTDFLYVGRNDTWKIPELVISDINEEEKKIKMKIGGLDVIFEFIKSGYDKGFSQIDNFKVFETGDDTFTIVYDTI